MDRSEALVKLIEDGAQFPVSIMKVSRESLDAGDYEDGSLTGSDIAIDRIEEEICDATRLANTEHHKTMQCWPTLHYCGSELDRCNEGDKEFVLEIQYSTMIDELQWVEDKQGRLPDDFVVDWKFYVHLGEMTEELAQEIEDYLT